MADGFPRLQNGDHLGAEPGIPELYRFFLVQRVAEPGCFKLVLGWPLRPLRLCLLGLRREGCRFSDYAKDAPLFILAGYRYDGAGFVLGDNNLARELRQGGAGLLRGYEPATAVAFAADFSDITVA